MNDIRDECYWLCQINQAACVELRQQNVLAPAVATRIAKALLALQVEFDAHPECRTGDYKLLEPMLIRLAGADVTRLHAGRSRMDLVATNRRLMQRDALLSAQRVLRDLRSVMLQFARAHDMAIVPLYTQGRQSAAVPFAFYISGYSAALTLEANNVKEAFIRVNWSPLGANAGASSSYPLDREALAQSLAFDGIVKHAFHATDLSLIGVGAKIMGAVNSGCLLLSTFLADLEVQYARTRPWLTLHEEDGRLTSRSSSMPHKVNPALLNKCRMAASDLIGLTVSYLIKSHNVPHGMPDFKAGDPAAALQRYAELVIDLKVLVQHLCFDHAAAADEVHGEYASVVELADVLMQRHDVAFRIGHHFAAHVSDYGKAHRLKPAEFPYAEACRLYREIATEASLTDTNLPLNEIDFALALTPANRIRRAVCTGGTAPGQLDAMLNEEDAALIEDTAWIDEQERAIELARSQLRASISKIADNLDCIA